MTSAITLNTQKIAFTPNISGTIYDQSYKGMFYISSTVDRLGIKEGSNAIILKPENKDFRFTSSGYISKVLDVTIIKPTLNEIIKQQQKGNPIPKDTYHHNFEITVTGQLKENNLLSDLEYSLKSVYRYNNPAVHFQTQYRDLIKDDFETISNGHIYAARTVFGKLVNSIPRQNKLEFMLQAMSEFSTIDFAKVPLFKGLSFLYDYIERRILNKGKLLVETQSIINEKLSDILPPNEVGFIDPLTEKYNVLNIQSKYFENLFLLNKKHNLKKFVDDSITLNQIVESRFAKIFEKETWPIDLKL